MHVGRQIHSKYTDNKVDKLFCFRFCFWGRPCTCQRWYLMPSRQSAWRWQFFQQALFASFTLHWYIWIWMFLEINWNQFKIYSIAVCCRIKACFLGSFERRFAYKFKQTCHIGEFIARFRKSGEFWNHLATNILVWRFGDFLKAYGSKFFDLAKCTTCICARFCLHMHMED